LAYADAQIAQENSRSQINNFVSSLDRPIVYANWVWSCPFGTKDLNLGLKPVCVKAHDIGWAVKQLGKKMKSVPPAFHQMALITIP